MYTSSESLTEKYLLLQTFSSAECSTKMSWWCSRLACIRFYESGYSNANITSGDNNFGPNVNITSQTRRRYVETGHLLARVQLSRDVQPRVRVRVQRYRSKRRCWVFVVRKNGPRESSTRFRGVENPSWVIKIVLWNLLPFIDTKRRGRRSNLLLGFCTVVLGTGETDGCGERSNRDLLTE